MLFTSPTSQSPTTMGYPGATPSISSNGSSGGIVWLIHLNRRVAGSPAILRAYSASDLSVELYNSSLFPEDTLGGGVKFTVPTIANGRVYVGTQDSLTVFGPITARIGNLHFVNASYSASEKSVSTIFPTSAIPTQPNSNTSGLELGVKFRSDIAG